MPASFRARCRFFTSNRGLATCSSSPMPPTGSQHAHNFANASAPRLSIATKTHRWLTSRWLALLWEENPSNARWHLGQGERFFNGTVAKVRDSLIAAGPHASLPGTLHYINKTVAGRQNARIIMVIETDDHVADAKAVWDGQSVVFFLGIPDMPSVSTPASASFSEAEGTAAESRIGKRRRTTTYSTCSCASTPASENASEVEGNAAGHPARKRRGIPGL
jgi:hypothetical protein